MNSMNTGLSYTPCPAKLQGTDHTHRCAFGLGHRGEHVAYSAAGSVAARWTDDA